MRRSDVWESLRVCSILLQPIVPQCNPLFPCSPVDATKALEILREPATSLSSIWEKSIDVSSLQCCSERLFTKLTKQQEKQFLCLWWIVVSWKLKERITVKEKNDITPPKHPSVQCCAEFATSHHRTLAEIGANGNWNCNFSNRGNWRLPAGFVCYMPSFYLSKDWMKRFLLAFSFLSVLGREIQRMY